MLHMQAFGVDIGGSFIKGALVNDKGEIISKLYSAATPDPAEPAAVASSVSDIVKTAAHQEAVGIGFPGVLKSGRVAFAYHMSADWLGKSAAEIFCRGLRAIPVVINDADAAAVAEMRFGAGMDRNNKTGGLVLVLTLGTGIGSALVHNGVLIPNLEFGHVELNGKDAEFTAAASVRTNLNLDWKTYGWRLQQYLSHLEMLLSFDLCIIGGGISENFIEFEDELRLRAEVRPARLANNAGVIGAALTAMLERENDDTPG